MSKWENEIRDAKEASQYKLENQRLRAAIEWQRDFICWLFEESEHCDHISLADAQKEFEEYQNLNP